MNGSRHWRNLLSGGATSLLLGALLVAIVPADAGARPHWLPACETSSNERQGEGLTEGGACSEAKSELSEDCREKGEDGGGNPQASKRYTGSCCDWKECSKSGIGAKYDEYGVMVEATIYMCSCSAGYGYEYRASEEVDDPNGRY